MTAIGIEALDIHNNLPYKEEAEKQNMTKILQYWSDHCEGQTNVVYERYLFNVCVQGEHPFDNFLLKLRSLVATCEYGTQTDDHIRDRIVCVVNSKAVRKQLLQKHNITLGDAISLCRAIEASTSQLKIMQPISEVNVVKGPSKSKPPKRSNPRLIKNCKFCGEEHERDKFKCPAYKKTCKNCGAKNYFKSKCPEKSKSEKQTKSQKGASASRAHVVDDMSNTDSDDYEALVLEEVDVHSLGPKSNGQKIMASFKIKHGEAVDMQVDSGATCNVIPDSYVPDKVEIEPCRTQLSLYNKANVPVLGKCRLPIKNMKNEKKYTVPFLVVKGENFIPLIGSKAAQQMNLITVNYENIAAVQSQSHVHVNMESKQAIKHAYPDVFDGHGKMPGKIHLETDSTVPPVVMPPRKVPISVKPRLKAELQRLHELDIIEPLSTPTDWVSALLVREKPNGKLRLCIDPKPLNSALKRVHYPMPVIEDILPELNEVKVFSKADLKEGFLQCELDDESAKLTTFQTPWGRYFWKRLAFGLSPSPEVFQQMLDQNLEGLPGLYKIADDILITGRGETLDEAMHDHDRNLSKFLTWCQERHITLNYDKFELRCSELPFMGHVLSRDGLKPDPKKVEAITQMPRPQNTNDVQRFVGMVKYLTKFIPDLSNINAPIRQLTHKDTAFVWGDAQETAFDKVKELVANSPVLGYYDPSKPLEAQGDASEKGLGFVLFRMANQYPSQVELYLTQRHGTVR